MQIHVLADDPDKIQKIRCMLEPRHTISATLLGGATAPRTKAASIVVDADLRNAATIDRLRRTLPTIQGANQRLFIVDKNIRAAVVQAFSLGASSVIPSPLDARSLQHKLAMHYSLTAEEPLTAAAQPQALSNSAAALASMFDSVVSGRPLNMAEAQQATGEIIACVAGNGLTTWLDNVRRYHEGTYQHCLLVTGIAVDFALHLGFNASDVKMLGVAATLHDVGKAAIPLEILDKPGLLDDGEMAIMQSHAIVGFDAVSSVEGMTPQVLDAIRHHHEFLDGSGYPDRLKGSEISDLSRVLTICDVFAALIEARSYRPPMPRAKAYAILNEMAGTKLEKALVMAFKNVAIAR